MIVVDTSALMAIIQNEAMGPRCEEVLELQNHVLISAGTVVELMIVSTNRGLANIMVKLLDIHVSEIVPVTPERAFLIAGANAQWGKGIHRAGLNFGDCFAYATAKEFDCPLLYGGNDFSRTDIVCAIPAG